MNIDSWCLKIRLLGSEPQIKWATTIRKKKLEEIKKFEMRHLALAIKPMVSTEDLKAIKCRTQAQLIGLIAAIVKYAMSCPHAPWWISHRDEKFLDWLPNASKICVEHFKTKPFK